MAHTYEIMNVTNSTTGIDSLMVDLSTNIPLLIPMILIFFWFIIFIGGYRMQKAGSGTGNAPMWSFIASFMIMFLCLAMIIVPGLISVPTLVVAIVLTIASGTWMLTSKE